VGVGFAIPIDAVRELLPELRKGTITRGRIGVQIAPVTDELVQPLGLQEARGALVRLVERDGPAAAAGLEPGDVIVRYDDKPVPETDDLVKMVSRTTPGTTVPVAIVRDGNSKTLRIRVGTLDVEDLDRQPGSPAETGFGMSLQDLTPQARAQRELPSGRTGALVESVDPASGASRAGIRAGDVILEVNRKPVSNASDAAALRRASEGETAFVLVWRGGQELFLPVTRR
jgi:serine protease Do